MPDDSRRVRAGLKAPTAGPRMPGLSVREASYHADRALIRELRFAVFVHEQGVAPDIEMDDRDPHCRHVLAFEHGEPVATGRLDAGLAGKIGRVAVLRPRRRAGIGTAVMKALHELAAAEGLDRLWCHAQLSALPFYQRLGYRTTGDVFLEADIEHVRMEWAAPDAAGDPAPGF